MTEYAGVVVAGLILAAIGVAWLWRTSARPSIIERLERSMVSNQSRLDSQEAEIDDLRRQIAELREGRIADHALLQEWITYARRLGQMLREATGQEPPPEPQAQPRNITADRSQLARHIAGRFSLSEIDGLAFELGMEGQVNGDTVEARAISLVAVAQRRGLLLRLVELCRRERPNGGF
jgi:hypothetical protein